MQTNEIFHIDSHIKLYPPEQPDALALFTLIQENKAYFSEFMAWPGFVNTLSDTEEFINSARRSHQKGKSKLWIIRDNEQVAGVVSFNSIDKLNKTAYFGYWLAPQHQGRGIIRKAIAKLIDHYSASGELLRFVIKCTTINSRSNAVARQCGFQHEGILRKAEILNGVRHDQNIYAYLAD